MVYQGSILGHLLFTPYISALTYMQMTQYYIPQNKTMYMISERTNTDLKHVQLFTVYNVNTEHVSTVRCLARSGFCLFGHIFQNNRQT